VPLFVTDRNTVRRGYDELEELYTAGRAENGRDVAVLDQFLESLPHAAQILDVIEARDRDAPTVQYGFSDSSPENLLI
jgi:hypothetical protein